MATTKSGNFANVRPLAVVTGASSGIGFELARLFATNGYDLVIAADGAEIDSAAAQLRSGNCEVWPVQVDLSTREGVDQLYAALGGKAVDCIAINAGFGVYGDFARETRLDDELKLINTNVTGTVQLAKLVSRDMVERGKGRILFTASIAGTMPGPLYACYAASKAFVLSFAEAIRNELADTGVTVTALLPGATETNFFARAKMEDTEIGQAEKDSPADVARDGFEALMAGTDKVIAGSFKNKVQAKIAAVVPETLGAKMQRKPLEKKDKQ